SEVYLKDQAALDRYLVEAGIQGRMLETAGGARFGAELTALVEHALRMKSLMAFIPRKYDYAVVEAMALAGALNPDNGVDQRQAALTQTAAMMQAGDAEAVWSAEVTPEG